MENRGRTYFTDVAIPKGDVNDMLFIGAPSHAGRGEAVVIFTYDPKDFASVPDPSVPIGRIHPGSIRDGRESVRFRYVGPNPEKFF